MAYIRTSLAVIVTGFLLVRGGLTDAEPAALAVVAGVISVIVIGMALTRFKNLGQAKPALLTGSLPPVLAGGIVALALIACVRLLLVA